MSYNVVEYVLIGIFRETYKLAKKGGVIAGGFLVVHRGTRDTHSNTRTRTDEPTLAISGNATRCISPNKQISCTKLP